MKDFADRMERPKEELKEELVKYPHTMYNPKTGASVKIMTKAEHDKYTKKGWVHSKSSGYQEELDELEKLEELKKLLS